MSSPPNKEIDCDFYKRLLVLSTLHSLEKEETYIIERLRGPSQPFPSETINLTAAQRLDLEDDKELRIFLDHLANVCANTPGGKTVTAVTVHLPQNSRRPAYLFFSNNRSMKETEQAKFHVRDILKYLSTCDNSKYLSQSKKDAPKVETVLLKRILGFNRERLDAYVKTVSQCLETLQNLHDGGGGLDESCQLLLGRFNFDPLNRINKIRYLEKYKKDQLLRLTMQLVKALASKPSNIFDLLDTLVSTGKQAENNMPLGRDNYLAICHKLRHALRRITSYHDAAENLVATARKWPQLFQGATVDFHSSIDPKLYISGKLFELEIEELLREIGLKCDVEKVARDWPALADERNKRVQDVLSQSRTHAEIQLWAHIRRISAFVPFRPGRTYASEAATRRRTVIGVSKLTCLLCHWFFQEVGLENIVIRSSCLNVYHRWTLPELSPDSDITSRLNDRLSHELSTVLSIKGHGRIRRTETDTDSQPKSPSTFIDSDESSCEASEPNASESEVSSEKGQSISSVESDLDIVKADM